MDVVGVHESCSQASDFVIIVDKQLTPCIAGHGEERGCDTLVWGRVLVSQISAGDYGEVHLRSRSCEYVQAVLLLVT